MVSHEDFIMQTGGQVSSAPGRRGSQAGRECLAPEGSPRLAPTRASSASSSSYILREVTRFPLPPDRRTCFSAQRGSRPQVPPPRSHTSKWATCHRCRRAQPKLSVRGCWLNAKLGVRREGKRILQESFTPTENAHPTPKTPWPGLSLLSGLCDPRCSTLRTPPHPQGAAHLGM